MVSHRQQYICKRCLSSATKGVGFTATNVQREFYTWEETAFSGGRGTRPPGTRRALHLAVPGSAAGHWHGRRPRSAYSNRMRELGAVFKSCSFPSLQSVRCPPPLPGEGVSQVIKVLVCRLITGQNKKKLDGRRLNLDQASSSNKNTLLSISRPQAGGFLKHSH